MFGAISVVTAMLTSSIGNLSRFWANWANSGAGAHGFRTVHEELSASGGKCAGRLWV
jgi:hypothetical protein